LLLVHVIESIDVPTWQGALSVHDRIRISASEHLCVCHRRRRVDTDRVLSAPADSDRRC
jgi:hypothetical protein